MMRGPYSNIKAGIDPDDPIPTGEQMLQYAHETYVSRLDVYKAFMDDIATCPALWIQVNAGVQYVDFAVLMTKAYPICVGRDSVAVPTHASCLAGGLYNVLFCTRNWDTVDLVALQWDGVAGAGTTVNAFTRRRYLHPNGDTKLRDSVSYSGYCHLDLTYAGRCFTAAQQMAMPAADIFKNYRDLFEYYDTVGKDKRSHSYAMDATGNMWGEQSWPEIVGVRTEYIDNVGVFIPDFCSIDFNLSQALGSNYLGLKYTRIPTIEGEEQSRQFAEWNAFIDFITGGAGRGGSAAGASASRAQGGTGDDMSAAGSAGAGIAQGIKNTAGYFSGMAQRQMSYMRLVHPRIRAFGRQVSPIPSYESFRAGVIAILGTPQQGKGAGSNYDVVYKWGLSIQIPPAGLYESVVGPLRSYVGNMSR